MSGLWGALELMRRELCMMKLRNTQGIKRNAYKDSN